MTMADLLKVYNLEFPQNTKSWETEIRIQTADSEFYETLKIKKGKDAEGNAALIIRI